MNHGDSHLIDLFCPNCDYNLTGLAEDRCPECGTYFNADRLRALLARAPRPMRAGVLALRIVWPAAAYVVLMLACAVFNLEWLFGMLLLAALIAVPLNTISALPRIAATLRARARRSPYGKISARRMFMIFLVLVIMQFILCAAGGYAAVKLAFG